MNSNENIAIIGAQWGDEGKGKIVDLLAHDADMVVRFQGGNNAGHTVVLNGSKYVLHSLPSSTTRKGVLGVIARGCVVNLSELKKEMDGMTEKGCLITPQFLKLSQNASIVFPFHIELDKLSENSNNKIGTTKKGIGPAYEDRIGRKALRLKDFKDFSSFCEKIKPIWKLKKSLIELQGGSIKDFDSYKKEFKDLHTFFTPFIVNAEEIIADYIKNDKKIIFEGAQGTMLDIFEGSYPYVTSSQTSINGIPSGSGVSIKHVHRKVGIAKAYCTRVGEGPFPTELNDHTGDTLQRIGNEFGATTGRKRRCGWLDLELLKKSIDFNDFNEICLTKLDVLTGFNTIHVKSVDGSKEHYLPGWIEDITNVKNWDSLPTNAKKYVKFIENQLKTKIKIISVGPGRQQILLKP